MPITVADLTVRARADVGDAQRGLNQLQTGGQRAATGVAGAFQRAGPAIGQALVPIGAAAGVAFSGAVESAAQLADEMANVRTVVPDADIAALTDEVQELSRASGIGTTDLTAGLYDLVSAGVPAGEAIGVLAASTNLAIGGLGTTAGAADVVTSALNAYGEGADQATRVTDIFALAIQKGKVTADEIGASIANIAPVAASAGISLEEVGAGYAVLTAKGVPAAQAATQMRAAISALLTPNETLNALQEQTGINFAELAKEKGLAVALEELRKATAGNATELDKLAGVTAEDFPDALRAAQDALGLTNTEVERFSAMAGKDGAGAALAELAKEVGVGDSAFAKGLGSIEAYQFALNATGDAAPAFQDSITSMFDATGTSAEQAAIKMDSPVEAGKRLFATFATFAQDVGAPFASTLGPILFGLNQMAPSMRGLVRPARVLGGTLGAIAGKVLPSLASGLAGLGSKLLPSLAGGFSSAFSGLVPMLGGAVSGVVTGIGGLFAAAMPLLVAALPFLLAAAVVAGIVLLIVNPEIRDAVFGFVGGIIGWIGDALAGLGKFLAGIFGPAFSALGDVIGGVVDVILAPVRFLLEMIASIFGGGFEIVSGIVSTAFGVIQGVISVAVGVVTTIFQTALGVFTGIWDAIAAGISSAVGVITAVIEGIVGVVGTVADAVAGFFDWLTGGTEKAKRDLLGVKNLGTTPVGQFVPTNPGGSGRPAAPARGKPIPRFQAGAWQTADGLAFLHAGEMVLPPDLADSFRRFLGKGGGMGAAGAAPGRGGSGTVVERMEVVVPITGLLRAEKPSDVADTLRRAGRLGYFTPRSARGM